MLKSGSYVRLSNHQKVPDEVAYICNMISEAASASGITEIRFASDDYLNSYIRGLRRIHSDAVRTLGKGSARSGKRTAVSGNDIGLAELPQAGKACQTKRMQFSGPAAKRKRPGTGPLRNTAMKKSAQAGSYTIYQMTDTESERSLDG